MNGAIEVTQSVEYSDHMCRRESIFLFATFSCLLHGCSSTPIIPEALEAQVDKSLTFQELVAAPESYQGRLMVLGGEVLKAKRVKEGTQIEILQLPLNNDQEPTSDRRQSQGRFLALEQESLDPATLAEGTRVTMVGDVTGAKNERLDEVDYRYPTLNVKHWHMWPPPAPAYGNRSGVSIGIFGGGGIGGGTRGGGGFGIGF